MNYSCTVEPDRESNTNEPENHHSQDRNLRRNKKWRSAHGCRKDLLLSKEERECDNEQCNAYAPNMSCDALCTTDARPQYQAQIQSGGKCRNTAEYEVRRERRVAG